MQQRDVGRQANGQMQPERVWNAVDRGPQQLLGLGEVGREARLAGAAGRRPS